MKTQVEPCSEPTQRPTPTLQGVNVNPDEDVEEWEADV